MTLKELFFFRIPQQFQLRVLGRMHQFKKFDASTIHVNHHLRQNNYSKSYNLGSLSWNENPKLFYFDCELDLSNSINWLKDYKNNKQSKKKYYANIVKQDFKSVGDIKYVFEPSRFYFLPFLALKEVYENDEKHLNFVNKIIQDWNQQNPYLKTVHWTSGIEVGIRSVNLVYTHMVLNTSGKLNEQIDRSIKEIIQYNYHYLSRHLSLYSSANNHLIAELTGLVVISSYFDNKIIKKQRNKWRRKLFREVIKQVNVDGVNKELCTHYHAEVTDHFLNAVLFVKRSGDSIPEKVENRFIKMFDFLDHVEYNGLNTIFGDNDEGYLIHPFEDKEFSIYRSLLQSAEIEYGNTFFSKTSSNCDLRNYLIFGDSVFERKMVQKEKPHEDKVFTDSGYAFLYDHKNKAKVSFDFGKIGDEMSSAHGHSDIFHFNLEINGKSILVDSGTFQYHKRYSSWRSYFRGIKAHNTISINNKDHALQVSRMSWIKRPETVLINCELSKNQSLIQAETNAFKKDNISHRRKLVFNKKENRLTVFDNLNKISRNNKNYKFCFILNFGNDIKLIHSKDKLIAIFDSKKIIFKNGSFIHGNLISATENQIIGWRSTSYGKMEKGQSFILEMQSKKNISLSTEIFLNENEKD